MPASTAWRCAAVDVNASRWDCTLEDGALRLGLRLISGLSETHARAIEQARERGPFRGWDDFVAPHAAEPRGDRRGWPRPMRLRRWGSIAAARCGRRWPRKSKPARLPLFEQSLATTTSRRRRCRDWSCRRRSWPIIARPACRCGHIPCRSSASGWTRWASCRPRGWPTHPADRHVRVAGLVLVRQRPSTAKGITFVTLEDETGTANLIIRQDVWQRFYRVARTAAGLDRPRPLAAPGRK